MDSNGRVRSLWGTWTGELDCLVCFNRVRERPAKAGAVRHAAAACFGSPVVEPVCVRACVLGWPGSAWRWASDSELVEPESTMGKF